MSILFCQDAEGFKVGNVLVEHGLFAALESEFTFDSGEGGFAPAFHSDDFQPQRTLEGKQAVGIDFFRCVTDDVGIHIKNCIS
jgi:hypothetical protein